MTAHITVFGKPWFLECKDAKSGQPVIAIVAVRRSAEPGMAEFVPLAKMFDGNPYEELLPPEGGE